jgi:hypothetical protein
MRVHSRDSRRQRIVGARRRSAALAFACLLLLTRPAAAGDGQETKPATPDPLDFSRGTATPSESCGSCHLAIYREFATGFGSDLNARRMVLLSKTEKPLALPQKVFSSATLHAAAGVDPFPTHARESEEEGRSCNVCHFPEAFALPPLDAPELAKPKARPKSEEASGLTCASCHLTPDGKIRGPYEVEAPHEVVADPAMRTAAACAYCHAMGSRVVGKQTQTFLEWRDDFFKPGLGRQHCQDCHMPRTVRKTAEDFDVPERAVARHLWTGGHSPQRIASALSLTLVQSKEGNPDLALHVINIGAGHSVPTGSNRRAVYLIAEALNAKGKVVGTKEWMFAPWYGNRPDDRRFLDEDKKRPDAVAATQADLQGPHEMSIRAGEERVVVWPTGLSPGSYTVRARLVYDLNRYNDRTFLEDQTEVAHAAMPFPVRQEAR